MSLNRLIFALLSLVWFRKKNFKTLALEILERKKLCAPNTQSCAKFRLLRLIRHFGYTPLSEITESSWDGYVLRRLKERPGCKFFDDRKYMMQVMLEAHRRGLVSRVPRLRIPDLPTTVGREITEAEIKRLFRNSSAELRFQIEIAVLMGLRLREMLFLRWDQFDWDRETIRFLPADTKTRRGREVPINPDLLTRFRKRFIQRSSPYVFPRQRDPARPRHDNKGPWRVCKRKANVRARWHDLRHTCATVALRRGNSVQAVKTYLGMSEQVLTRIYQHLNIEDLRIVARAMSSRRK